jgi:hypothetical protein
MEDRGAEVLVAVHLGARGHQHVFGEADASQAVVGALHSFDRSFIALRHDHHQVHVAVIGRRAPGVRAEKPDLFGLKFRHEPLCGRLKQSVVERFHGLFLTDGAGACKPRKFSGLILPDPTAPCRQGFSRACRSCTGPNRYESMRGVGKTSRSNLRRRLERALSRL